MALRGYSHRSPVRLRRLPGRWPEEWIDLPGGQLKLLAEKYVHREPGRIPLPRNVQELWAQHKYSVMARDPARYREIGRRLSVERHRPDRNELALELTGLLRLPPPPGRLRDALQHMWGYVADRHPRRSRAGSWSPGRLLRETQRLSLECEQSYLLASTALSELEPWIDG